MTFHHFTDRQIIPLLIAAVILVVSILFFNIGKTKISLLLLFVGSLVLGFFMANLDPFLILWDEQYHALVAKNLMQNPLVPKLYANPLLEYDYRNWTGNEIWLHKQPLFLWQIALSLKLLGCNTLAVRLPSIILHAIAVILIYRIGKISSSERIGFYGGLFFALAYYPLELVAGRYSTDHNDLSFLFYVTGSLWAWFEYQHSQNKYCLFLIGLFSGCAVLVKWLVGLFIYPIWILIIGMHGKGNGEKLNSYRPVLLSLFITVLVFVPWQIYILVNFPQESVYEFDYNSKHFFQTLENHEGDIWFHFDALKDIYGSGDAVPFIYLLGIIVFLKSISLRSYRYAIFFAVSLTYLFYSLAATKMTSYCIIVSPLFFLGLASLVDAAAAYVSSKIRNTAFESVIRLMIPVTIGFFLNNIPKIQHYHTDWKPNDNCNRKAELKEMEFIHKLKSVLGDGKYVVFNSSPRLNGHIPVMFFTDYVAYDFIPTEAQMQQIEAREFKMAILDNGKLPYYIENKRDMVKIKWQ
jgi:4-amino-4-deoxy-L-arabinose transferase